MKKWKENNISYKLDYRPGYGWRLYIVFDSAPDTTLYIEGKNYNKQEIYESYKKCKPFQKEVILGGNSFKRLAQEDFEKTHSNTYSSIWEVNSWEKSYLTYSGIQVRIVEFKDDFELECFSDNATLIISHISSFNKAVKFFNKRWLAYNYMLRALAGDI